MSEPVETNTTPAVTTPNNEIDNPDEGVTTVTHKRPAEDNDETDNREAKALKLDNEQSDKESTPEETEQIEEETASSEQSAEGEPDEIPQASESKSDEKETSNTLNNSAPILNLAQGAHPPPPGLHLLSDPQQQQLLQSYVQAQGQDLANLTATSLAQAMVSPIAVPTLASNLLQQLHQSGNIITALPGPPPQIPHQPTIQHNPTPLGDDAQNVNKRANSRSLTNDEKRQRRLLRNRVAAKECRKKKKKHIQDMEERIVQLEDENAKLSKEVEELKAQLTLGPKPDGGESYSMKEMEQVNAQLMKEVEELKTKLSLGALDNAEQYRLMKEVEELNAKLSIGGSLPAGGVLTTVQQQQKEQEQSSSTVISPPSNDTPEATTTTTTITTTETPVEPAPSTSDIPSNSTNVDIKSELIETIQASSL